MIKKTLIALFIFTFIFIAGCSSNGLGDDIQVKVNDGSDFDIGNGNNWCIEGSVVDISGSSGNFKLEVIGVEDNGEYKGMCHMRYQLESEEPGIVDYYIDQNKDGYQIINKNGQQTRIKLPNSQE